MICTAHFPPVQDPSPGFGDKCLQTRLAGFVFVHRGKLQCKTTYTTLGANTVEAASCGRCHLIVSFFFRRYLGVMCHVSTNKNVAVFISWRVCLVFKWTEDRLNGQLRAYRGAAILTGVCFRHGRDRFDTQQARPQPYNTRDTRFVLSSRVLF